MSLIEEMKELETAEDFLSYFKVCHDPKRVRLIRMLLLTQFRVYKDAIDEYNVGAPEEILRKKYSDALSRAYRELTTDPETIQMLRDKRREEMPQSSCAGCSESSKEACGHVETPAGL